MSIATLIGRRANKSTELLATRVVLRTCVRTRSNGRSGRRIKGRLEWNATRDNASQ